MRSGNENCFCCLALMTLWYWGAIYCLIVNSRIHYRKRHNCGPLAAFMRARINRFMTQRFGVLTPPSARFNLNEQSTGVLGCITTTWCTLNFSRLQWYCTVKISYQQRRYHVLIGADFPLCKRITKYIYRQYKIFQTLSTPFLIL